MSQSKPCHSCTIATTRSSGYCKRCDTMRSEMERVADTLEQAAAAVRKHGPLAWMLTADWQTPLRSVEGGGAHGKGTVSRPTETAALAPDPLAKEHALLRHELAIIEDNAISVVARIKRVIKREKPQGRVNTSVMCANLHGCPDDNFSDRDRGRCKPCANYLRNNGRDRAGKHNTGAA